MSSSPSSRNVMLETLEATVLQHQHQHQRGAGGEIHEAG
jgi:hypothetical protein